MVPERRAGACSSMLPVLLCLLLLVGESSMFQVTVTDGNLLLISLDDSDVMASSSVYVVKITGESKNYFFQFEEFNSSLPSPLVFNASYHGLYYIITLMVINANLASRAVRSVTILTKPLPVSRVLIHDYKPSPETGVVFEVYYPEKFNVFTRVNISYWEGSNFRTMLYKDFFKGKTVFNHWLPGTCYRDVTFQLVSEASFNKSTLVESSGIGHTPQQHRTAPFPPRIISIQILQLNESRVEESPGGSSLSGYPGSDPVSEKEEMLEDQFESSAVASSHNWSDYKPSDVVTTSGPDWWLNETVTADTEGFINEIPPNQDNQSLTTSSPGADQSQPALPKYKLLATWFPPQPPTAFDGFNIYIQRDENRTEFSTVDETTHEYVKEIKDPGKYKLTIRTFSSSGSCPIRESDASKAVSFYISK
ncbi:receptor-type tyrosine-protein phosphatase O-like [Rhinoderma darwinii]|uniref:receptor-type tyrosine-protein phosphatase O-like n=1 Tax=Rhinoderma darwinii TaxID=43563 RepID=UPI003F669F01